MTCAPPSFAGGAKLIVTVPLPAATAETFCGAVGTLARGVTLLDVPPGPVSKAPLVAVTVNVYGMPFVRPVTVKGLPEPVELSPPGLEDAT
jgi:hypothetical protein